MTSRPFTHDGRTYVFKRQGNEYTITRDDGLVAWDTYGTGNGAKALGLPPYHAYKPAFPTVRECQAAIRGERTSTYYHKLIFAASAYQAQKIREEEDRND